MKICLLIQECTCLINLQYLQSLNSMYVNVKLYEACFEFFYQHSKNCLKSNLIDLYTLFKYLRPIFYHSIIKNITGTTLYVMLLGGNLRDLHISYGTTCKRAKQSIHNVLS